LLEKTVALARASQYKPDLARALISLGRVRRAQGQAALAAAPIVEGLRQFSESGSRLGIATALEVFAALEMSEHPERAARLFGSAEALRSAIGAPLPPVDRPGYERDVAAVRAQIGEPGLAEARARAHAEPYEVVVADTLAFSNSTN
jgi:hypothetical protein